MAGTATLNTETRPFSLELRIPQDQCFWHLLTPPQPHPALEFHSLEHAETWWVCCPESCSTARHLSKLAKPRTKQGVGSRQEGDLESRNYREPQTFCAEQGLPAPASPLRQTQPGTRAGISQDKNDSLLTASSCPKQASMTSSPTGTRGGSGLLCGSVSQE